MSQPLKYHDEIVLRFEQGRLCAVYIDGVPQNDVKSFAIEASVTKVAVYTMEHSTVYLNAQKVADDFGSEIGEDLH